MTAITSASDAAGDCVIRAIQERVGANDGSADSVAYSWQLFRLAVADGNARQKRRAVRWLQRALIRTIGLNYAKHVSAARRAVSSAIRGVVVWDLAENHGEFTPPQRALLMAPWVSVLPQPEELSE
jgi:hypothetical protein